MSGFEIIPPFLVQEPMIITFVVVAEVPSFAAEACNGKRDGKIAGVVAPDGSRRMLHGGKATRRWPMLPTGLDIQRPR